MSQSTAAFKANLSAWYRTHHNAINKWRRGYDRRYDRFVTRLLAEIESDRAIAMYQEAMGQTPVEEQLAA